MREHADSPDSIVSSYLARARKALEEEDTDGAVFLAECALIAAGESALSPAIERELAEMMQKVSGE